MVFVEFIFFAIALIAIFKQKQWVTKSFAAANLTIYSFLLFFFLLLLLQQQIR